MAVGHPQRGADRREAAIPDQQYRAAERWGTHACGQRDAARPGCAGRHADVGGCAYLYFISSANGTMGPIEAKVRIAPKRPIGAMVRIAPMGRENGE